MNDQEKQLYTELVHFLGKALGNNTEVVLQDVSNQSIGIAAIVNGHISGRKVGDDPSDFVLEMANNDAGHKESHRVNFSSIAHGGKALRSSTLFLRDEDNKLTGMLCLNTDISEYLQISEQIKALSGVENFRVENNASQDTDVYLIPTKEVIMDNINNILKELAINMPLARLNAQEKQEIVLSLQERGMFNLKGAVTQVAQYLNVSEPTVYRYLSKRNNRETI